MKKTKVFLSVTIFVAMLLIVVAEAVIPGDAKLTDRPSVLPIAEKSALGAPAARAICTMQRHNNSPAGYWNRYEANTGTYTYFDPAVLCGPPVYPFAITDFSFTLYDDGSGIIWPAMVDVVVYDMPASGDPCDGPGAEICRFSVTADQATFGYPNIGTATFPTPCCVNGPFFIGLEYTSGTAGTTPSILFDDNQAPDQCFNWQFDPLDGIFYEWYDFWAPPIPGYPIFWVDGDTQSPDCPLPQCVWNPGDPHKMHFPQLPDETGWDVYASDPMVLADDWMCSETGWVKDIHFWGSWRDGLEGEILYFILSIHSDISADQNPDGYSKPGPTLWEYQVPFDQVAAVPLDPPTPEGWYDPATELVLPNNHQAYFQYNICLPEPMWFWQDAGRIYWLNISAILADPAQYQWGWKSSVEHWNDDATWAYLTDFNWREIYEPGSGSAGPISNDFMIFMDPAGNFLQGDGTEAYGEGWYFYPQDNWWNIWFYDHPFDYTRYKTIHIEFDAHLFDPTQPAMLEFAVNWSTDAWSLDQPPGDSSPPLPGVDEALYIGREILMAEQFFEGHYIFDYTIPNYNPEWVSIDVRGFNFAIPGGFIIHDCIGEPRSLDLSFVITGEPPPPEDGACCLPDGTCAQVTQAECGDLNGVWLGPGTQCTALEACCLPDGTCIDADPLCCQQMGGVPQGVGSQCTQPEACCLPDGSCIMVDPVCCDDLGGSPQGPGTQCSANTEACCFPDGTCKDLDPLCCVDQGGTPQGTGSVCLGDADGDGTDDACQPEFGACCFPDGSCLLATQADCQTQGGIYQGDNSICLGDINGNGIDDACEDPWNPDDGHKMHYPQLPDEAGWDVNASFPAVVADDWQCSETGWVKDIHFWGSWLDGNEDIGGIIGFIISIHEDIPVSPTNPYSRPGKLLWEHAISNFKATKIIPPTLEGYYDPFVELVLPDNHQEYYQYDVYLPEDLWFHQESGTIYWLNITARLENPTSPGRWGWKSSIEHFNDDAVFGVTTTEPCVTPEPILPATCPSTNPDEPWVIDYGVDGSIEFWPTVNAPYNIIRTPMAEYDIVEYQADVTLDIIGTGSLAGFYRSMTLPAGFMVREYPPIPTHPPEPGKGWHIETEIVSMNLNSVADPDFDILRITAGEDYGLPSPGHTTLTRLPDGTFNVDSFFDIYYRIEFQGAPGSALEGLSGSVQGGPTRMQQGGAVVDDWRELFEPPNFEVSMDMAFVITGEPDQICDCIPGDANGDGMVNVGDAVYLIAYVFKGGPAPVPYRLCSGDANCDCQVNVGDAVYIINYVFKGGPPPCDCLTWLSLCGPPLRK